MSVHVLLLFKMLGGATAAGSHLCGRVDVRARIDGRVKVSEKLSGTVDARPRLSGRVRTNPC